MYEESKFYKILIFIVLVVLVVIFYLTIYSDDAKYYKKSFDAFNNTIDKEVEYVNDIYGEIEDIK